MPSNDNNLLIMVLQIMPFMITKYNITVRLRLSCRQKGTTPYIVKNWCNEITIYLIGVCYILVHNKNLAEFHTIQVTHKPVTKENWIETGREKKLVRQRRVEPVNWEQPLTSAHWLIFARHLWGITAVESDRYQTNLIIILWVFSLDIRGEFLKLVHRDGPSSVHVSPCD